MIYESQRERKSESVLAIDRCCVYEGVGEIWIYIHTYIHIVNDEEEGGEGGGGGGGGGNQYGPQRKHDATVVPTSNRRIAFCERRGYASCVLSASLLSINLPLSTFSTRYIAQHDHDKRAIRVTLCALYITTAHIYIYSLKYTFTRNKKKKTIYLYIFGT